MYEQRDVLRKRLYAVLSEDTRVYCWQFNALPDRHLMTTDYRSTLVTRVLKATL